MSGKRIGQAERKLGQRVVEVEHVVRRVEVEAFAGGERGLVVGDGVSGAQHRSFLPGTPRQAKPRREVVAVRGVTAARNAAGADADQRLGGGVVHVGAVRGIYRRR